MLVRKKPILPEVTKFESELANRNIELKLQKNNLIALKMENTERNNLKSNGSIFDWAYPAEDRTKNGVSKPISILKKK